MLILQGYLTGWQEPGVEMYELLSESVTLISWGPLGNEFSYRRR